MAGSDLKSVGLALNMDLELSVLSKIYSNFTILAIINSLFDFPHPIADNVPKM
jgi:hypothetical protein